MTSSNAATLTGADRADILDLYARYALAIDFGDGSGWADCFTSDGTFTAHRGSGVEPRHIVGREELDRFARNHRAGPNAGTHHHFTNIATWPASAGALGRATILYVEGNNVLGNGLYEDDLVRDADAWLFARRVVTHDRLRP